MITMLTGDCRDLLRTLPAASVHCVVTSPPYWGLRDYGTATWEGGNAACAHVERTAGNVSRSNGLGKIAGYRDFLPPDNSAFRSQEKQFRGTCGHCGAIRIDAQLGLEPDFNAYVAAMVAVFREVRRVLRDDGTLWLNLGDSYARQDHSGGGEERIGAGKGQSEQRKMLMRRAPPTGLKNKDLCGIPWRVAFALQADGWYLRQDIIWAKPNPMPESVTDRCTKAHEYLFLLSKRERYYYDAEAIKEPTDPKWEETHYRYYRKQASKTDYNNWDQYKDRIGTNDGKATGSNGNTRFASTRNKRSVWEVTTQPFSEAHFATFPPALIEPCIKAGCPKDGTVLDPFAGAGTTGLVADRLQRNAILIELNPTYAAMGTRRITDDAPLFVEVAP